MIKYVELLNLEFCTTSLDEVRVDNPDSLANLIADENIILSEPDWTIQSVKCAAHTLQLCIHDAVKDRSYQQKIDEFRGIVKKLRKKPYRKEFHDSKKPIPKIDVVTRWSSTFDMLNSIVNEKEFISFILRKYNIELLNEFQTILPHIINIHKILMPLAVATTKLQSEQMTLGDLFVIWEEIKLELHDLSENILQNEFRTSILTSMANREKKVVANDSILAAIYLDPRFNYNNSRLLSESQKNLAKV